MVAEMQKFVDKYKAKASKAGQARSRMKMIEKIEISDVKHSSRIAPHFHFVPKKTSGKHVIKAEHLNKSFNDKMLFKYLDFKVDRGEKVAIMGVNGIGKSTLIKILTGMVQGDEGQVILGHEVRMSYFAQYYME
jgi:ATPase subunit of ABC transporter with duplicated ATPase domains